MLRLLCLLAVMIRGGGIVTATVLHGVESWIELPSSEKRYIMKDTERLEVLATINKFRSDVKPTAADMLAIVSMHCRVPAVIELFFRKTFTVRNFIHNIYVYGHQFKLG